MLDLDFSKQFAEGAAAAQAVSVTGPYDRVICCGMGGSIIPAEMLSLLWLPELNLYLHRSYDIPFWANPRCLIVCTSWSGNTEETISSFQAAVSQSLPVVAITTGGKLADLARPEQSREGSQRASASYGAHQNNVPLILLPNSDSLPPRLGTGRMLAALLTLLNNSAIIKFQADSISLASRPLDTGFVSRLTDKTPLIYSSYAWRYLACFWKTSFNENTKIHAFNNYLPEAVHNEIAGFTGNSDSSRLPVSPKETSRGRPEPSTNNSDQFFPILLIDREEMASDVKKLEKLAQFFKNKKIDHQVVDLTGASRLAKVTQNYRLALACSVALAAQLGRDPLDISTIEEFKQTS